MSNSGVEVTLPVLGKAQNDLAIHDHMTDRKILLIGCEIKVTHTDQTALTGFDLLIGLTAAALRPAEHNHIDNAFASRKTSKHRNHG